MQSAKSLQPILTKDSAQSQSRARRRWRLVLLCLLGTVIVLLVAVRLYLGSSAAAQLVSQKLSVALGTTVHVKSLSPGFTSTGIATIEIEEADGANHGVPWAKVKEIDVDASIVGLAFGKTPQKLTLKGADVTLRFDAQGELSTRLPVPSQEGKPGAIPVVRLEESQVTIIQEGHSDSVFAGINAELREENGKLHITGDFKDDSWGHWSLGADVDSNTGAGHASVATLETVPVSPEVLRRVPFVRPAIWDAVSITGETTLQASFDFRPRDNRLDYLIEGQPARASVYLPAIDLTTTDTSGSVTIENSIVTLQNVHGQAASGKVDVDGVLNFHDQLNHLDIRVVAHKLQVDQLPANWWVSHSRPGRKILPQFFLRSELDGEAKLKIVLAKSGTSYGGSGNATLRLRDFTAAQAEPIRLHLKPHAKGFEFEQKDSEPMSQLSVPIPNERQPLIQDSKNGKAEQDAAMNRLAFLATLFSGQDKDPKKTPPSAKKAALPKGQKNYVEVNMALHDVDLAQLVQKLEVTLPFKISGKISVKVKAGIPTDTPGEMKTYRLTGTANLPQLTIEGITLDDVRAKVVYRDGKLTLDDFGARVPDANNSSNSGSFKGTASLGLIPEGDLVAKLDLDRLPIGQILGLVPELAKGAAGSVSGHVDLKAPANQIGNPAKWTGNAQLHADDAKALGWAIQKFRFDAKLADGKLTLEKLSGNIEGSTIDVSGDMKLVGKYPFQGRISLNKVNLGALSKLSPKLKPPVDLAGQFDANADVSGDLKPLSIQAGGTGSVAGLQIDGFPIEKLSFRWDMENDHFKVSDFRSQLFGGDITGSADVPLRNGVAGSVGLKMKGIDLTDLSKKIPSLEGLKFEGTATGSLKATISAAQPHKPRAITADVDIQATKLKVRNIPADSLHAKADYRNGVVSYKVDASALGGTIELDGRYPPPKSKEPPKQSDEPQGRLNIHGIKLARLWPALGLQKNLDGFYGEASLNLPYHFDSEGKPKGSGTFRLVGFRYNNREIAPQMRSAVQLSAGELRFDQIDSIIGTGTAGGSIVINLLDFDRSKAVLRLHGVPAASLLFPFPELAQRIKTPLDAQIRTSLGRHIRGTAVVGTAGGSFSGYQLGSVRVPIEWDVVPSQQRGEISIRDLSGEMAQGRLSGQLTYQFFGDAGGRVEGGLSFRDVNIPSLIRTESNLASYGLGRATGRFDFSGSNIRSVNDLSGKLTATLGRAQLSGMPVLREVSTFLGSSGQTADRSDIRATLSRGVWQVERLALLGRNLQLFASGTISTDGRLDLNVNANTGQLNSNPLIMGLLAARLPLAIGALPVELLAELSVAVTTLTVNLAVTGTIANPSVRVRPVGTLKEEALRFFLGRNNVPGS